MVSIPFLWSVVKWPCCSSGRFNFGRGFNCSRGKLGGRGDIWIKWSKMFLKWQKRSTKKLLSRIFSLFTSIIILLKGLVNAQSFLFTRLNSRRRGTRLVLFSFLTLDVQHCFICAGTIRTIILSFDWRSRPFQVYPRFLFLGSVLVDKLWINWPVLSGKAIDCCVYHIPIWLLRRAMIMLLHRPK